MTRQQKNHLPQNYQHSDFTPADYQLVKGVIKSIGITIAYPDYQDLLQEGALILLEARQVCDRAALLSPRRRQNYYFRRVKWRLLDLLRSQRTHKIPAASLEQPNSQTDQPPLETADPSANLFADNLLFTELTQQLWQRCSAPEQLYLAYRLQNKSITAIAQLCQVSRPTVYQWKRSILAKLKQLDEQNSSADNSN
ncbi:MAG: sigma-70 family RNA polymerase sigma factor [Liquorilactobacillus nagelii]|uniref:sigma-70 family RNA polymerase sigma factor n=1 Tax=Liquorilactobacillus nagelii TaxID=82688 RepID=UPI0039ED7C6E